MLMLAEVQCRVSTERNNLKQVSRRAVTSKARSVHREKGGPVAQTQLVGVWVSHVLLALLVGRSTCLRSGPWGLALCGGPLRVQADPPTRATVVTVPVSFIE